MKLPLGLVFMVLAAALGADELRHLANDFNSGWHPATGAENPVSGVRRALPPGCTLLEEEGGGGFLRVDRTAAHGSKVIKFERRHNIPSYCDFTFSIRCRFPERPGGFIWFATIDDRPRGGVCFANGEFSAYDENRNWKSSGIKLPPPGEWVTLEVKFSEAEKSYQLAVTGTDGDRRESGSYPFLHHDPIRRITIGNAPPVGTGADFDDLLVTYDRNISLRNRVNGMSGALVRAGGREVECIDGRFPVPLELSLPSTVEIDFARPTRLTTVVVRGGGAGAQLTVSGMDAAGSGETTLAKGKLPAGDGIFQQNFVLTDLARAKIALAGSGTVKISEINFAGLPLPSENERQADFRRRIYGEFRCAVWSLQKQAVLHLINADEEKRTLPVTISGTARKSGEAMFPERRIELKPGENFVDFALDELESGDYIIRIADASNETTGEFQRLLRYYPPRDEAPATGWIGDVTGKKLFFPDGHWLEQQRNLTFSARPAELEQVIAPTTADAEFARYATRISLDDAGNPRIDYFTLNRNWDHDSKRFHRAIRTGDGDWESHEVAGVPPRDGRSVTIGGEPPAAAKPDWELKARDGREIFNFYVPDRDGKVQLNQVKFKYTGAVANNTVMWKNSSQDWGVLRVPPRSIYPVWRRGVGDTLILNARPMLIDKESFGEFEDPDATHDNFVGQWLSDDGKTLFFAHGRWLKTHPPFESPAYDNMRGLRILGLWSTRDGINFELDALIPPDENDSPVCQQYGGQVLRPRGGYGLFLAYILRYRSDTQQIDTVLAYSWDGRVWRRTPGNEAFLGNGEPESWHAGTICAFGDGMHPDGSAVEVGNETWQLLSVVSNLFHHQAAQISAFVPDVKRVNADFIRRTLGGRGVEKWPYFERFGGYEGFAEHSRQVGYSVGIARFRRDGWFFASAGTEPAELVTRPLTASGAMDANIRIAPEGFAEFTLLSPSGEVIPGFRRRLENGADQVDLRIFESLPTGEFRIRVLMADTELYTLSF